MQSNRAPAALALIAVAGQFGACSTSTPPVNQPAAQAAPQVAPPALIDTAPRDYTGLHNVVAYHSGFYSGSAPGGDPGFDTLQRMGVKTIISVDGAEPDADAARARGIRYIHLPIGYNGFDETRRAELARATRDAIKDGPVYIHCHHGKHRSAGAAAAIAASLGWLTPEQGVERMKVSGTAPNYTGLYTCALESSVLGAATLNAVPADFPEVSRPQGLVKSMVEIDDAVEHLKLIEKAGWRTPADHPDLVPVAEAGKIADLFRILHTDERVARKPADFAATLAETGAQAQSIEDLLVAPKPDAATLSARFKLLNNSCTTCHAKYRD